MLTLLVLGVDGLVTNMVRDGLGSGGGFRISRQKYARFHSVSPNDGMESTPCLACAPVMLMLHHIAREYKCDRKIISQVQSVYIFYLRPSGRRMHEFYMHIYGTDPAVHIFESSHKRNT